MYKKSLIFATAFLSVVFLGGCEDKTTVTTIKKESPKVIQASAKKMKQKLIRLHKIATMKPKKRQ